MTDEQINIKIAELCGWARGYTDRCGYYVAPPGQHAIGHSKLREVADMRLPNYAADLNACHEFEEVMDRLEQGWPSYAEELENVSDVVGYLEVEE